MKRNVRRRRALVVAALLLVLGLAVYLTLDRSVFVARDVQVEGNSTIPADDIIRAADLPLGSPMREVSEEKARAALKSSGTVELVSLEKHYPSLVVLNVRERRCDAVVSYAGVILTMERDGTVISQPSAMPETDAVYVTGLNVTGWQPGEVVSAPASQLEALVTTLDALYDNAATGYVSELNVSNPHALYLYSRTGMRVDLGDSADMDDKVLWMVSVLPDLEARGETSGRLDVSSGDKADHSPG